jgi:hypothetical protein
VHSSTINILAGNKAFLKKNNLPSVKGLELTKGDLSYLYFSNKDEEEAFLNLIFYSVEQGKPQNTFIHTLQKGQGKNLNLSSCFCEISPFQNVSEPHELLLTFHELPSLMSKESKNTSINSS